MKEQQGGEGQVFLHLLCFVLLKTGRPGEAGTVLPTLE